MAFQSNTRGLSRLPSSRNHGRFDYDVFLSFRGDDTRNNFTGLFHHILELQGIHAFFDEEDLHKGDRIEEILGAISRSRILVPIFSQRYAESKWCLREVDKMLECCSDGGQESIIIPIFFHVDPSDVRHQTGPFKAFFKKHQKERKEEVDDWKRALENVGRISGYHLKKYNGNQRELVISITAEIHNVLTTRRLLAEDEYLVGLGSRVGNMMERLDFQVKDVRMIVIHGVGGIGKTTLAKVIYNRSRHLFQASSYIENVREISRSKGLIQVQQQLIQDISRDKHKKEINNLSQGAKLIEDMVRAKSVLLVLDDVDDEKQLALVGNLSWFYLQSRIIVTTRQVEIFKGLQDAAFYMLEELDEQEALQLFNHHAFGDDGPQDEYINLSKVVSMRNRLPLVLQVLGSLFRAAKTPEEWKKLMKETRRRQVREVHEKLRICYDSLSDEEKIIFLDIACFLVHKNAEDAIHMWEDHKLSPYLAIRNLKNKSLIKINQGKFEMHDQIRDMGREIVRRESPHPRNRSRLWHEEDVMEALTKYQDNKIEGIILNLREGSETKLSTDAFEFMPGLRILHINFAVFDDCEFTHFPANLKWLEWKNCPLETLPLESKFKSIVVLNLSGSSISQLWRETTTRQSISKSKREFLTSLAVIVSVTPNFMMAPNLEKLILDQCINLKKVDDSIGSLKSLVFLSMRECVSLKKLPNKIYELSSLTIFNLEGCSRLLAFPQILDVSKSERELDLDGAASKFLRTSTSKVVYISETTSSDVTNFTDGHSSPKGLILRGCESLEFLPHLHKFQSLRSLHIDDFQSLYRRGKQLFEDVAFRGWDIEEVWISGRQLQKQEFSFGLPFGSLSDPLLLQHLQCHGYGDPCGNRTMTLHVRHEDVTDKKVVFETMHEVHCHYSTYKDGVHPYFCTISFGSNDKINEAPRSRTIIMKVTASNNFQLTKVDVKLQKTSKFGGTKPFINISRKKFEVEFSIFCSPHAEEVDVIEYSAGLDERIDNIKSQLDVQNREQTLLYGWTIKELIILSLIFSDVKVSWYEHGERVLRQTSAKVFDKIKVLDLSYCKFFVKTPDFSQTPHLERLILDHCKCLLEIAESVGQLKKLVLLSLVGCAKLHALPGGVLQLNSLRVLSLEKCSGIKILPKARMTSVSLDTLQVPVPDDCSPLIRRADYVGRPGSSGRLSFASCHSFNQLPYFFESLEALQILILDGTSLTEIPDYVGRLRTLDWLSMRGCFSLKNLPESIGTLTFLEELILDDCPSLERLPDSIGNLTSLKKLQATKCGRLKSVPDLSNLMALEELNVADCKRLIEIPGLHELRSLKVLHMNGCCQLDLYAIRLQLKVATFHDLEEFSVSTGWYIDGAPFPRGRRTSSKPLLVERISVTITVSIDRPPSSVPITISIKVVEKNVLYAEAVAAGASKYVASFEDDDEINKYLRVAAGCEDAPKVGALQVYCPFSLERTDICFRQSLSPEPGTGLMTPSG